MVPQLLAISKFQFLCRNSHADLSHQSILRSSWWVDLAFLSKKWS
jgi:hypothetical protein